MLSKLLSFLLVVSVAVVLLLLYGASGFSFANIGNTLGSLAQLWGAPQHALSSYNGSACLPDELDPEALPPHGVCPTKLPASGPVEVLEDNTVIENLDIDSPDHSECGILISDRKNITVRNVNINHAGAGICIFNSQNIKIEVARLVNTISVAGPHCKPGLSAQECKFVHRRKSPEKLFPVNSHNNIWIKRAKNVSIDTVYMEKGESGIFTSRVSGLTVNNFYCRDIRGPYWRGQCVQVVASDGARLSRFYTRQFLETSSGHDNISAFESSDVEVSDGLIDGNWSRHGAGVIADTYAHDMTVRDIDILNNGTSGAGVWSGPTKADNGKVGRNFHVINVRVKGGHCETTWYGLPDDGPSSGGLAFSMHPAAEGAKFENSVYWDHCNTHPVYIPGNPVLVDITEQDFEVKRPPIDINFPWL